MKLRVILIASIIVLIILLSVGFFTGFFNKSESFTTTTGINANQISKITVQTDSGENKIITSKDGINNIIKYFNSYSYSQTDTYDIILATSLVIAFYSKDKEVAKTTITKHPLINKRAYEVKSEMDIMELRNILGLFTPTT